ncbi:MAG TPA: symmetrical bis(5'-nucleosyl)-tetraphosphatase [Nitrosomonas nitrosa]|jgi:bis(5'-nucleosyl)-tetraphosphatase (symmetrical)|uniref:symmetrical bis(5'-nucleosyl)-tetraphosphatase n=1 Tax=Nitrosomonas nitrosa TaxID=52442 RepID=UPI000D2FA92B|nr:symmetrical bis(5'-nucleosyl)-tetraphosphatase [Nitrosomonas nitrosa]PTQ98799.1 bis(5'nucleosyl)-tetraphosphatase ApaH [Nitrosomonas nitrosa]HBZ30596.1 symmetrical bis(5'-nucleosyl)-tetraphosphatase [Nitrosomonas nitrosa]HNP50844.1 symmetrical bis(5'-nucleosyl)-tetraphosphatase [Nitrosomonas nitrosa]
MATYAIGDLQGCHEAFQQLTELIGFNVTKDKLWLVGDIVNRGTGSLPLLRFIMKLGDSAVLVLGNHDLHLLLVAEGFAQQRSGDTLQEILEAPDRQTLLSWLRQQRLFYAEDEYALVHAGLLPSWDIAQAAELAQEVEAVLRGEKYHELLLRMYGDEPNCWSDDLEGYDRFRVIINAMTRLRICTPDGRMEFSYKGQPRTIPSGYLPWFEAPQRASSSATVVFGHWSALGLQVRDNILALDTGCLWGGQLTAIRLEDRRVFQVPCARRSVAASQR